MDIISLTPSIIGITGLIFAIGVYVGRNENKTSIIRLEVQLTSLIKEVKYIRDTLDFIISDKSAR